MLAIAGLIFLMVFVALPALQRSQRDTQRRDDMARFMSQLSQYQANNNGRVPTSEASWTNDFILPYLRNVGVCAVTGVNEEGRASCSGSNDEGMGLTWDDNKHQIYVYTSARCDGENIVHVPNSSRQVAIKYKLEGAGIYCNNN